MSHLEDLAELKEKHNLKEIAIFSKSGQVLETTQKTEFKAFDVLYSVLGGAANQISSVYDEKVIGLILRLESTEFYIYPTKRYVVALEYKTDSINEEKAREIVSEITGLYEPIN